MTILYDFDYQRPRNLSEALELLEKHGKSRGRRAFLGELGALPVCGALRRRAARRCVSAVKFQSALSIRET